MLGLVAACWADQASAIRRQRETDRQLADLRRAWTNMSADCDRHRDRLNAHKDRLDALKRELADANGFADAIGERLDAHAGVHCTLTGRIDLLAGHLQGLNEELWRERMDELDLRHKTLTGRVDHLSGRIQDVGHATASRIDRIVFGLAGVVARDSGREPRDGGTA